MKSTPVRPVPRKKQVRLDLRRAAPRPPEDDLGRRNGSFWKWFLIIALFHLALLIGLYLFYNPNPRPPQPKFISLVPLGDTVKGTPGTQSAPKVGASTPAPTAHHHTPTPKPVPPQPVKPPPPPPQPQAVVPPKPTPVKPVVHEENAPHVVAAKPKPKPVPKKVKVDLHLVERSAEDAPKKPVKPAKKKVVLADDEPDAPDREAASSTATGLSKEQIAQRLGHKMEAAGVTKANKYGVSGAADGHNNSFGDFYASIHDQVMNKWQAPNQDNSQATDPIVQIHVEKNGHVPPGLVTLLHGSGNASIDESALSAARNIGYTLQPLPDGCPPDISITFTLTR